MLGTVFHYAVVDPRADHAECDAQRRGIIAYHERIGYRRGGAYNGHFCVHGGWWLSYTGPNQATGDSWANLNLEAWCYLAGPDTPVTPEAQQTAYALTLRNPRDRIHPHSDFFPTSCCGDPLRAWIRAGALPPSGVSARKEIPNMFVYRGRTVFGVPVGGVAAGDRVLLTLDGPDVALGLSQAIIDWKAQPGRDAVPIVFLDPTSLGALLTPPAQGGGGGGITEAQVRAIIRAELDATGLARR